MWLARLDILSVAMWVEFVISSNLTLLVFLQVLRFSLLLKTSTSNSDSIRIEDPHLGLMWLPR